MSNYDVAAYIWPAYTGDEPRTKIFWPEGIGEWQSVKNSVSKYPGHNWPRKPLWGYVNEADPYVMEGQIAAAADHGVNVFIYDWYWYENRPFLEQCLNNGYLKARNNDRVKFYLMWANHSVNYTWDIRNSSLQDCEIWDGAVDRSSFEQIALRTIDRYFSQPSYYKIDGKPVYAVYDAANLIRGLGGVENTRRALDWFREQTVRAGFPGLHLQLIFWSNNAVNLSGVDGGDHSLSPWEVISSLGFDSITHYQFAHFANIDRDYRDMLRDVQKEWAMIDERSPVRYYPPISVGWDNNPRFMEFRPGVVKNNTPDAVEEAVRMARAYVDAHPGQAPLITLNSWNEWTETSYLQPDDLYGYGYLEAVRKALA